MQGLALWTALLCLVPCLAVQQGKVFPLSNEYPFFASLTVGSKFCNGALLDRQYIVTSADCARIGSETNTDVTVRVGTTSHSSAAGSTETVFRYMTHPTANIAVVQLLMPLAVGSAVGPLTLATDTSGTQVASAGCTSMPCGGSNSGLLTVDAAPLLSSVETAARLGAAGVPVRQTQLYGQGQMCSRDWGAPLFKDNGIGTSNRFELVGVYGGRGPSDNNPSVNDSCGANPTGGFDIYTSTVETGIASWIKQQLMCTTPQVIIDQPKRSTQVRTTVCMDIPSTLSTSPNEIRLEFPSEDWQIATAQVSDLRGIEAASSDTQGMEVVTDGDHLDIRFKMPFVFTDSTSRTVRFTVSGVRTPNNCDSSKKWKVGVNSCTYENLLNANTTFMRKCPLELPYEAETPASASSYPMPPSTTDCRFCTHNGKAYNAPTGCTFCNACESQYFPAGGSAATFQCEHDGLKFTRLDAHKLAECALAGVGTQ